MNRAAFSLLFLLSIVSTFSYGVTYTTAGFWEYGTASGFCDAKAAEWNAQHEATVSYETVIAGQAVVQCLQEDTGNLKATAHLQCPPGYSNLKDGHYISLCSTNIPQNETPPSNSGDGCSKGNPITLAGQQKFQEEVDFVSSVGQFPLRFVRYFNSGQDLFDNEHLWRHYYDMRIKVVSTANAGYAYHASLYNADGRVDEYEKKLNSSEWTSLTGRPVKIKLEFKESVLSSLDVYELISKTELEHQNGLKYVFDQEGLVTKIIHPSGEFHSIEYSDIVLVTQKRKIVRVTHSNGDYLRFSYSEGEKFPSSVRYNGRAILSYDFTPSFNVSKVTFLNSEGSETSIQYQYDLKGVSGEDTNDNGVDILERKIDEEGQTLSTWSYDNNKITSYRGDNKERTEVEFIDDLTTKVTNPFDQVTTYKFLKQGGMRKLEEVEGESTSNCVASNTRYEYDANGSIDKVHYRSDPDENSVRTTLSTTDYTYTKGLLTDVKYASGSAEETHYTFAWHGPLQQPSFQSGNGQSIDYTYTSIGRIDSVTLTDLTDHTVPYSTKDRTQVVDYSYLFYGNDDGINPGYNRIKTIEIDGPRPLPVSDLTTLGYDTSGRLTSINNALNHITQINAFNWRGQPTEVVDANGVKTVLEYNFRGWLTKITLESPTASAGPDRVTTINHYKNGLVKQVILPEGDQINYEYNEARHLEKITNELNEVIDLTPNTLGDWGLANTREPGSEQSEGVITRTQERLFDDLGRLMDIKGANGQRTHFDYDRRGNLNEIQEIGDGKTLTTDLVYDRMNRLVRSKKTPITLTDEGIVIGGEEIVEYRYQNGHLHQVIDPNGLNTIYTVDGFGNRIRMTSPDTGVTTFTYDEANNLTKRVDDRGVTTEYTYDALNRLTGIHYPQDSTLDVQYIYDEVDTTHNPYAKGRLTRVTDASGSVHYFYDYAGNIIRTEHSIGGQSYVTEYRYNLNDALTEIVYPSGRVVTYERKDSPNRISAITTQPDAISTIHSVTSEVLYYPFGPVKSLTLGNDLTKTVTRDLDYRVSGINVPGVMQLSYGYTQFNDIQSITDQIESANNQTFEYDELFRLVKATGSYGVIDYHYDLTGNRKGLKQEHDAQVTHSEYRYVAGTHQLEKITATADGYQTLRNLTLDAVGNTIKDQRVNLEKGYTYAEHNRLTEYRENGTLHATYRYNALGQRVQKTLTHGDNLTLHYLYDLEGRLIAEYGDNQRLIREYLYLNGEPIALIKQQ